MRKEKNNDKAPASSPTELGRVLRRVCFFIPLVIVVLTLVGLIWQYINIKTDKDKLENRVYFLEREIESLKSELEIYKGVLVELVKEDKVSIEDLELILPVEEWEEIKVQVVASTPLPADVDIYFYPSGLMGDAEKGEKYVTFTRSKDYLKITYKPGPTGWAGIFWQYPDSNWGDKLGRNLTKAKKITFWVKGAMGGEIVEFKSGGIRGGTYEDSFEVSLGKIKLSPSWKQYEIDLSGQDLSNVIGAFAWVATKDLNPVGLTFYLKDIYFEK